MDITKFSSKLIDKLQAKGLSENTIKYYMERLYRLNDKKNINSIKFLRDTTSIINKLNSLSTGTKKSYSGSIISVLELYPTNANRQAIEIYKSFISNEEMDIYKEGLDKKTDKQDANWMSMNEIRQVKEHLEQNIKDIDFTRKKMYMEDYLTILKNFLLSLYINLPPRRSIDYSKMKLAETEEDLEDTDYNYYYKYNFIFNNYKTKSKYGTQLVNLFDNDKLLADLELYLKYRKPNKDNSLLIKFNGKAFNDTNDITKLLNIILGKKIGTSLLRNIYLTDKYGNNKESMKEDANAMGTSVNCINKVYCKTD